MPITIANEYALSLTECAQDTPSARACLHRNEDKIEDFSKWSQNMVRFVRSILEEAESTELDE